MFNVTKTFIDGLLKGLTITETTSVVFEVGQTYKGAYGSPSYVVTAIEAR